MSSTKSTWVYFVGLTDIFKTVCLNISIPKTNTEKNSKKKLNLYIMEGLVNLIQYVIHYLRLSL
jgi:uncharacterized membrane protein